MNIKSTADVNKLVFNCSIGSGTTRVMPDSSNLRCILILIYVFVDY
jgi:hypothetical protein